MEIVKAAPERAKAMQSMILNRMAPAGTQGKIAAQLQVDDATVSRWKGDLERTCLILTHLGLKIVDAGKVCVPPSEIAFLRAAYNRIAAEAPWMLNEGETE